MQDRLLERTGQPEQDLILLYDTSNLKPHFGHVTSIRREIAGEYIPFPC
ncbi:MAG: hypothetical protein ACPL07_02165 [Candidatus Bathyarchaeia archaeon]